MKTGQDRDRTLDELLRRAVPADAAGTPAGACLDAETAAAWMEDTLAANERVAAEAHVADCSRCQALLGALARSEPAVAPARSGWLISPMRWLVPAGLTAAVGLAVFLLIPHEVTRDEQVGLQAARSPSTPGTTAVAPSAPAATSEMDARERASAPATPPQFQAGKRASEEIARQDESKELRQAAPARDAFSTRAKDVAQSKPDAAAAAAPSAASPAAAAAASAPTAAPVMAPPAAPPAPVAQAPLPPAANEALAKSSVQNRAGASGGAAGGRVAAQAPAAGAMDYRLADTVGTLREVSSPDAQSRWRIVSGSTVERSSDGGRTWVTQDTPPHAPLTAAAAPASTVCWVVGKARTVLLTVDGSTWQTLAFPVAVDLVAVVATTADAATVTTADGRVFVTTDRGKTWTAR